MKSKPKTIICDLDGVLIDSFKRSKPHLHLFESPNLEDFKEAHRLFDATFLEDPKSDKLIKPGVDLLYQLLRAHMKSQISNVHFITARSISIQEATIKWLDDNIGNNMAILIDNNYTEESGYLQDHYHFRDYPSYDTMTEEYMKTRENIVSFKKRIAEKILEDYNVIYAIDDTESICQMYSSLDIPTIKFIAPKLGK